MKTDLNEISKSLRQIAFLLEYKGENAFKIKAYQNGAETLENLGEDLGSLIAQNKLTTLRGIGEALAGKIVELYSTGSCEFLDRLKAELPKGVIELSRLPGLSTKRIHVLVSDLGISSVAELENACRAGQVSALPGFGKKIEEKLLAAAQSFAERET
jgi:DNA polymerase (family 10)